MEKKTPCIAIIDDETVAIRYYIRELEISGFEVNYYKSTEEFKPLLNNAKINQIDFFIVDIMIPPGSLYSEEKTNLGLFTGLFLAQDIRKLYKDPPIMLLSNFSFQPVLSSAKTISSKVDKCLIINKFEKTPAELALLISNYFFELNLHPTWKQKNFQNCFGNYSFQPISCNDHKLLAQNGQPEISIELPQSNSTENTKITLPKHSTNSEFGEVTLETIIKTNKPKKIMMSSIKWPQKFDVGIQVIISPELESVFKQFGIDKDNDVKQFDGALFYRGEIDSKRANKKLSIVVLCQDRAGNEAAAYTAERMINRYHPRCMFLLGIAAGRRGKCKIGDVVESRIVIDDTQAVAQNGLIVPRTRTTEPPYSLIQVLKTYHLDTKYWYRRLNKYMKSPPVENGKEDEYSLHVAIQPECLNAGIYSSDMLLKDPNVLEYKSLSVNQQIKIGEMEAGGFSSACMARDKPTPWFVIRGVSDFGDEFKSDKFQEWASHSSAAYLYSLLAYGIRIDLLSKT